MPYSVRNRYGGYFVLTMDASNDPAQGNDYKFWLTFEQAAVGIAIVRSDGRLQRANPELCKFLGYRESELQELKLQNITHRDDIEAEDAFSQRLNSGDLSTYRSEKRFIRRNGKVVWGLQSTSLVRDRAGKPLQYILVIQDITERKAPKKTENPAKEQPTREPDSSAHLEQFLSMLPIGMLVVDAQGEPYFANAAARSILGQGIAPGAEDEEGSEQPEVYSSYRTGTRTGTGEQYPLEDAPISRALMGHSVVVDDIEILRPDAPMPVQVWAAPVYDAAGKVAYAVAAIGERPQSGQPGQVQGDDNALTNLLRFASDIATAASITTDLHSAMQSCIEKMCFMTGLPAGHILLTRGNKAAHNGAYARLGTSGIWHIVEPERFSEFRRASESMTFGLGEGLPGIALATREAAWTTDLDGQAESTRSKQAHALGITTSLAFPLLADGAVMGVVEFFSHDAVEPDPTFLDVMSQIGAHLGNAILRRAATDELERSRARYEALSEISLDFISALDVEGKYMFAGRGAETLLGYDPHELNGSSALTYCHPEDVPRLEGVFSKYLAGADEQAQVKYRTQHKNGEYVWLDMALQPLAGTYGRGRELIALSRKSQEQAQPAEQEPQEAEYQVPSAENGPNLEPLNTQPSDLSTVQEEQPSNRDPLTGLFNRQTTDETLITKLTSRRAATFPVGCLFIDVDNFDALNSTYGEEKCDRVLKHVAELLEDTCRDDDFLGRHSGSTFVIVLSNTDAGGTIIVGEKVLRKVRETNWNKLDVPEPVKVSIGGTCIRHGNGFDLPELMEMLGSQLLQAKGSGGDCIIMNAREAARQSSGMDPLGGWTHLTREKLKGES